MRAADLIGVYTSSKDEESERVKQTSGNGSLKPPAGVDQSQSPDGDLFLEDDEARGVLYCDIGPESNTQSYNGEANLRNPVGVANEEP